MWDATAQAMIYDLNAAPPNPTADLNLLVAPMYAFLYSMTGETKYRDQGDLLFAGGVQRAWLDGSKQFNQNYWWSFDYVVWRQRGVVGTPPSRPVGLTVASGNPPAHVRAGGRFTISDTVKNGGTAPASVSTTRYILSLDTSLSSDAILLSGNRTVPLLAPGATSSGSVRVRVPTTTPTGSYFVLACADWKKVVTERDEGNNCRASATKVTIP
jgi:hypothetical protein